MPPGAPPIQTLVTLLRYIRQNQEDDLGRYLLSSRIDWPALIAEAEDQGVAPFLWWNLSRSNVIIKKIPEPALDRLRARYYESAIHNADLHERLGKIYSKFAAVGIDAVLLKGLHLAYVFYGNPALRPIYDIDLLIKQEDVEAASDALRGLGYLPSDKYPEDFYEGDIMVDLHDSLISSRRIPSRSLALKLDEKAIRESARTIRLGDIQARVLSSEDLLIYQCLHLLMHHGLEHLLFLLDIDLIFRKSSDEIDWNEFAEKIRRFDVSRAIYYVFLYAQRRLSIEFPNGTLEAIKPKKQSVLEKLLLKAISEDFAYADLRYPLTFLMMKSSVDKMKFLRESLFPAKEILQAVYGDEACYARHLKRVAVNAAKGFKLLSRAIV